MESKREDSEPRRPGKDSPDRVPCTSRVHTPYDPADNEDPVTNGDRVHVTSQ